MTAYYNEIDPYAAQWLRNLIKAGHIAAGDVDERSIRDVRADDLRGYTQCHFFAGIGGWSVALRLAGWPDSRSVWTGSCPCQPFSAAGAGKAADDERHLWPAWFPLIAKCGPPVVFGEQVEAAVGWGWLDAVFADMEGEGYACGATVLPACGIGAPHIRQRLWFVAHADREREQRGFDEKGRTSRSDGREVEGRLGQRVRSLDGRNSIGVMAYANGGDAGTEGLQRGGEQRQQPQDGRVGELANSDGARCGSGRPSEARCGRDAPRVEPTGLRAADLMGDAAGGGQRELRRPLGPRQARHADSPGPVNGFWRDAEWIACTDGKARPIAPGTTPLGYGIPNRSPKLRAYGNAIVPQVAAEFIRAAI